MPDKYQNKYRIPSARLQTWYYGWNAAYFVTICTQNREHYFGEITSGNKMEFLPVGIIADILWHEIKNHTQNIELDAFIVMPNHIHGIIILNGDDNTGIAGINGAPNAVSNDGVDDGANVVETRHALSLQPQPQPQKTIGQQRFQNQGKNTLSSIIGSYKSAVTKHANRLEFANGWQSRFYDHVIRDEKSFQRIRQYIINNPQNWDTDKFNKGKTE